MCEMKNFNGSFKIKKSMNFKELSLFLDAALFAGFTSSSARFPVTSFAENDICPKSLEELYKEYKMDEKLPSNYTSSTKSAHSIPDFKRNNRGIECIFMPSDFLLDENKDCLGDKLNFKIVMSGPISDNMAEAACNFAFRVGMELTSCESGILAHEGCEGNAVVFMESSFSRIYLTEGKHKQLNICCGSDIVPFLSEVLNNFPYVSYGISWERYLEELTASLRYKNLDGQLSFVRSCYDSSDVKGKAYCEPSCEKLNDEVKSIFPNIEFINYNGLKEAYCEDIPLEWEKDTFEKILDEKLFSILKAGDSVEISAALSENSDIRGKLTEDIKAKISQKGADCKDIMLTCAYKQGFSWIEEYELPKLIEKGAEKVEISFKPFLPEGETVWKDENGATPTSSVQGCDTPDKWLDIPIRFLQELYPVDDLVAEKLGVSCDNISFKPYEGKEDITYLLKAYDKEGREVLTDKYKAHFSERPYLTDYPGLGKVHPSTGFLKVTVNGKTVIDENVKTDLENIWDKFNGEVLRGCKEYIESRYNGRLRGEDQPFFSCLRLEAYVSEPERVLSSRQDMISPLDALHEDMYFVASDYFKNLGAQYGETAFDAPGLILPVLHVREGRPSFKVTMYDHVSASPCFIEGDRLYRMTDKKVSCRLGEIYRSKNGIAAAIDIEGADSGVIEAYASLLEKNALHANSFLKNVGEIRFREANEEITAVVPKVGLKKKDLPAESIDFPEDEVIGYQKYIDIVEKLKGVEGIEVYEAGRSYSDRIIYAIDVLPKNEDGYVSRTKRLTSYPSQLVNCRHHANEVSSTNACFKIIKKILTDPEYKDIGNELNLTFVPVENPDGTAIHEELSKENPLWKLHVARFDALSKEFFREIFNKETIHTEALAFTRLFEDKLPDLVVDNHGVPTHEWEQQFSGYTSPMFKGFWLPRSVLYGYFWYVPQEEFKDNILLAKRIEHDVAAAIGKDSEMDKLNVEMAGKFEKYAHNYMPKLFPADYYMHMINYWVKKDFSMDEKYVSYRYPWITTTYYTSEVADETAQGEYLKLCTKAHFTHNMAILDIMRNAKTAIEAKTSFDGSRLFSSCVRHRPIIVLQAEEI